MSQDAIYTTVQKTSNMQQNLRSDFNMLFNSLSKAVTT